MNTNGNHKLVEALAQIRQEWETAAAGESLLEMRGNVALILADVAEMAGLTTDEKMSALGTLAEMTE